MKVPIPPECTQQSTRAEIVCAEKGRKISFLNPNAKKVTRHAIDGCMELRKRRDWATCKLCDFVVVADWRSEQHFVELKGANVEHALLQLASAIERLNTASRPDCWIITTESPSTTSKFMVLKERFEKRFGARLRIRTNQCVHKLD